MTYQENRTNGITPYCMKGYEECVMNYELAKADDFDPEKWEIHHKLENYFNRNTLIDNKMYYNVCPFDLIWLPTELHRRDRSVDPDQSKYHKRICEKKRGWKDVEKYKACEGKHQLQDHDQYKRYHLEYQRKFREENPDYYTNLSRKRRAAANIGKIEAKIKELTILLDENNSAISIIEENGFKVKKSMFTVSKKLEQRIIKLSQRLSDAKALLVEG